MTGWRSWALTLGVLLGICGIALLAAGGGPVLLIVAGIAIVTALLEPIYGRIAGRPPLGGDWRPTDEKFVDPESGQLVTVWFDPASGERRYVAAGRDQPRT
jgi:hypothetical protein